jgi:CspA family cold shock protein
MAATNNFDVEATLGSMATVEYGVVRWFDAERGFGFVIPAFGDVDLFLDVSEIIDPSASALQAGQPVSNQVGARGVGHRQKPCTSCEGDSPDRLALSPG